MAEVAGINSSDLIVLAAHVERRGVGERTSPKVSSGRRGRTLLYRLEPQIPLHWIVTKHPFSCTNRYRALEPPSFACHTGLIEFVAYTQALPSDWARKYAPPPP